MTRHQESPFTKSFKSSNNKSAALYEATNSDVKTTDFMLPIGLERQCQLLMLIRRGPSSIKRRISNLFLFQMEKLRPEEGNGSSKVCGRQHSTEGLPFGSVLINQYLIPEYPHLVKRRNQRSQPCILDRKGATDGAHPKGFMGGHFSLRKRHSRWYYVINANLTLLGKSDLKHINSCT